MQKQRGIKSLLVTGAVFAALASGCDVWVVRPAPYTVPTPLPTRTPSIYTPTPIILAPPVTGTAGPATLTPVGPAMTGTPLFSSPTPSIIITATRPPVQVRTQVLGCNTSVDISHAMGEVTNAYITVANTGAGDLTQVCATLRGLDEGRPHPDKTKCVSVLLAGYQVTLKLTVDTTFKEDTPIQVDVSSEGALLQRVGQPSCTDIGLFPPNVDDLGVVKPIP
jgi:hypothetical protein